MDIFLDKLKEDSAGYKEPKTVGYTPEEKKKTIRSLMNIRMPGELSDELVDLQEELKLSVLLRSAASRYGDCMERVIFNVFKDSDRSIYEKIL